MTQAPKIGEEEFHAYVDGLLDSDRRAAVELYLRAYPEYARRAAAYSAQRQALKAAFAWRAAEPIPASLNLSHPVETRLRWLRRRQIAIAATAAMLIGVIAGAAGQSLLSRPVSGVDALAGEAIAAHRVFVADVRRPVEMRAEAQEGLLAWLSERLGARIIAPDLQPLGFRFMGGRLVAAPKGPAALLMYDDDRGVRLTLYIRRMQREREVPVRIDRDGAHLALVWVDHGVGFSLAAPASAKVLEASAQEIRRQFGEAT